MNSISSKKKCLLKALNCFQSSEADGDEIYLKIENRKIWPQQPYKEIKSMDELPINISLSTAIDGAPIKIELWEKDFFTSSLLGYFLFVPGDKIGKYTTDLKPQKKNDIHRYVLAWEI